MATDNYSLLWQYLSCDWRPAQQKQDVYRQVSAWIVTLALPELCRMLAGAPSWTAAPLAREGGQANDLTALSEAELRVARKRLSLPVREVLQAELQRQLPQPPTPPTPLPLPPPPQPPGLIERLRAYIG